VIDRREKESKYGEGEATRAYLRASATSAGRHGAGDALVVVELLEPLPHQGPPPHPPLPRQPPPLYPHTRPGRRDGASSTSEPAGRCLNPLGGRDAGLLRDAALARRSPYAPLSSKTGGSSTPSGRIRASLLCNASYRWSGERGRPAGG
jgi:hypothetical protein